MGAPNAMGVTELGLPSSPGPGQIASMKTLFPSFSRTKSGPRGALVGLYPEQRKILANIISHRRAWGSWSRPCSKWGSSKPSRKEKRSVILSRRGNKSVSSGRLLRNLLPGYLSKMFIVDDVKTLSRRPRTIDDSTGDETWN